MLTKYIENPWQKWKIWTKTIWQFKRELEYGWHKKCLGYNFYFLDFSLICLREILSSTFFGNYIRHEHRGHFSCWDWDWDWLPKLISQLPDAQSSWNFQNKLILLQLIHFPALFWDRNFQSKVNFSNFSPNPNPNLQMLMSNI